MDGGSIGVATGQLRSLVERIERLEEEKATIAGDIKEVYAEAKANGFDIKILRKVVKLRKFTADERAEEEAMIDLYLHALGMTIAEKVDQTGQGDVDHTIALADAAKQIVDSVPEGGSVSVTTPAGDGFKINKDDDGNVTHETVVEMPDIPPELDRREKTPAPA
jgi:uncharacterized protein (UPF0335 family)